MAFDFIHQALQKRRQDDLLRQPIVVESSAGALIKVGEQHFLNFSSNDYLGQRQNHVVMQAWVNGIADYGVGSAASPLVTGHTRAHQALQDALAQGLQRDKVLLFSSGFAANQAICQALLHEKGWVIADKLMHASFNEGAMSSKAKFLRFAHNDLTHLRTLLAKNNDDCLIATEGVFSMDGDQAPLDKLSDIAQQHQAWLMVDDAHGFGVFGETGMGCVEQYSLSQAQVPILMGTFGKAIGTSGAFVAGSEALIDFLTNFAKHYIYSTAMPPAMAVATLASVVTMQQGSQREVLRTNISLFKALCAERGIPLMPSNSAIQPIFIGSPNLALQASNKLKSLGIWVTAIRYPTVPKGKDRLRITLSASHQKTDIQALVDALCLCHLADGEQNQL